jgi:ribosomal protein S18 acetylase RimI-like enzyme
MAIDIRPAQERDVSDIAKVVVDAWRSTFAGILPADFLDGLSYDQQKQRHRKMFERPGVNYHVACSDGAIVGFASGGPTRRDAFRHESEVYAIYLLAEFQYRHLGSVLFRKVATDLKRSGRQGLVVVALSNNPHRGFYQRLGGVPVDANPIALGSATVDQIAYLWDDVASLGLEVVPVSTDMHWRAYHDIRRRGLFEARGLTGYDECHPDDRCDGHFPLLLLQGDIPVGAARLDLAPNGKGVARTVAIDATFRRKGFGRALMIGLETLALQQGVASLEVNAASDAIGFYRTLGWTVIDGSRTNPLMTKALTRSPSAADEIMAKPEVPGSG